MQLKLKMLSLRKIVPQIRSEDWFVRIDLKDAYFHISILPCHRRFPRFGFGGKAYQNRVLPFGLALSPCTFTKCVDAALVPFQLQGIRIMNYIDDWLILAQSYQLAVRHRDVVLAHMKELGLWLNAKKSVLSPLQRTTADACAPVTGTYIFPEGQPLSHDQGHAAMLSCLGNVEETFKSNQITFIVTSPQHKCLGEWNSYERAPDSAEKQQTIYIWTDSAKKQQTIYLWTDSAKKQQTIYLWTDSAKKQQTIYLWTDSAKKQQTIYIWTDSAKKLHWSIYSAPDSAKNNNNNLHMDRQCKKNNSNLHMDRQCKKQQQFTYGQYIFTDCTEDNVQNTHTYTQYA